MKKFLWATLLLLIVTITATAADNSSQARSTLDKAAAKVNLSKGATANFTISGGNFGTQSGSIAIKGNKFNARTGNNIVWYNGNTQWFYSKKNNEVNVSTPSAAQQSNMNPYYFLTLYKSGYTLTQTNAASGYQVHMVGNGKSISELYVLVDKQYNIKQVKMKQKNQWITINISGLKQSTLSDSAFSFNSKEFPDAEVIDLR